MRFEIKTINKSEFKVTTSTYTYREDEIIKA